MSHHDATTHRNGQDCTEACFAEPRPIDRALRLVEVQLEARIGKFRTPPEVLLADAFVVAEAYLKLCVATGRHSA